MTPTVEQQILSKLDLLHTKLFGEEDGENPHGRLPRLEHARFDHEDRIVKLEKFNIKQVAIIGFLLAIGEVAAHLLIKGH